MSKRPKQLAICWYRSDKQCPTERDCLIAGHCCECFDRPGKALWFWREP